MPGSGSWQDWRWDPTLFEGAAPFYVQGRLPYAPGLAEAMADAAGLDGTGRLLDVGSGPGVIALRLAHLFDEVIGLDPDAGMLQEAQLQADAAGVTNAQWVELRAEELPAGLGSFRLITFTASFHWMDRPRVARAALRMLDPTGAVVQVDNLSPTPARDVVAEIRTRHLGPDRRAGQSIRNDSPSGEEEIFAAAGFTRFERRVVPDGRVLERTIDDVVAAAFSSSPTAPHLFPDGGAAFESDLRAALAEREPDGHFPVPLEGTVLRIRYP